jgi:hypothetical protein
MSEYAVVLTKVKRGLGLGARPQGESASSSAAEIQFKVVLHDSL